MPATHVHIEPVDDVAVVRLERAPANAFDLSLARELDGALSDVESSDAKSLVLTGSGDFFSAGLDLKVVPGYSRSERRDMILALGKMVGRLYAISRPTIAAVNGHAVAAGTLLALACDYRVGPQGDYRFGFTGARVGIPYPIVAQAVIESELDPATTRIMLLGAEQFGPDEAVAKGILDELREPDEVLERAIGAARRRSQMPAETYGRIKQQLRAGALERIHDANRSGDDPSLEWWMTGGSADVSVEARKGVGPQGRSRERHDKSRGTRSRGRPHPRHDHQR